jgi:hypothetical protein
LDRRGEPDTLTRIGELGQDQLADTEVAKPRAKRAGVLDPGSRAPAFLDDLDRRQQVDQRHRELGVQGEGRFAFQFVSCRYEARVTARVSAV